MSDIEKLAMLEQAFKAISAAQDAQDKLAPMMFCPESPVFEATDILIECLVSIVATAVGDDYKWVDWFVFENEMGRKGLEAGKTGRFKPIKTAEDLLEMINGT